MTARYRLDPTHSRFTVQAFAAGNAVVPRPQSDVRRDRLRRRSVCSIKPRLPWTLRFGSWSSPIHFS